MKNKWLIAASAVGIHISIGSVYAWSVLSKPMMKEYGWSLKEVSLTFSIAIFFLGLAAAFLGHFVQTRGPRLAGSLSAFLFGTGLLIAGIACQKQSLILLYLGYGVLGGMGIGIGYIAPISTLIQWFPNRRGLATGIAIMGFGFASLICGPLSQVIMSRCGIPAVFYILACAYFILIFGSSQYLAPPAVSQVKASTSKPLSTDLSISMTAAQALGTARFYLLWGMFFINITCGIGLLSVASPLAQEQTQMTPLAAEEMVGFVGLFNGMGRFGWSSLSDIIGRKALWITFFVIEAAAFFFIGRIHHPLVFQIVLCLIITCYGGGFASMPAFISDIFGSKQVSAILGFILTAWSAAGLVGPMFIAWIRQTTGSYEKTFSIFAVMFLVGLAIEALLMARLKKSPTP